jgi:hypothetical protein
MDINATFSTKDFISKLEVIENTSSALAMAARKIKEDFLDEDVWTVGETLTLKMYFCEDPEDNWYSLGFDMFGSWWEYDECYAYEEGCPYWSVLLLVDQMLKD